MKYRVYKLARAQADVQSIFEWLRRRSPQGAEAWLDAYDSMVNDLS